MRSYGHSLISLAVKMPNFWGPKKTKRWSIILLPNVWFQWKLQTSLLISYHHPWWMFGSYLICRNMSTDYVCFWKSIHAFKEHTSFVWIYSQMQVHTMLYVVSSPLRWRADSLLFELGLGPTLCWFQTSLPLTALPRDHRLLFQSYSSQRPRRFGFTEWHRSRVI